MSLPSSETTEPASCQHSRYNASMTQTLPISFYMLCGSLWCRETTLLMRLLEYWNSQGHNAHERGGRGQYRRSASRHDRGADPEFCWGCICCDTKDDLAWSIAQLVQDYESTVIVLECSGMADPQKWSMP